MEAAQETSPENSAAGLGPGDLEYRFRARPIGGETVFRLTPDALKFEGSNRKLRVRYADIARVRLGFRPANLAAQRFLAEVWLRAGGKLSIASVSARGMFNSENQGKAYNAFVTELCRRIGAAQPALKLEAGMPAWRWWPAAVFGLATFGAVVYLLAIALRDAKYSLMVVIVIFAGLFASQIGTMIYRNRPRRCGLDSIPAEVLPSL